MKVQLVLMLAVIGTAYSQFDPNFAPNRQTIVHLFEWKWNDIAEECERFLDKYGYGGVQVSPVNENRIFNEKGKIRPWFERYQPVSYKLDTTRSGNEAEFKSMVQRCNAVGVRIYVDAVINHMCGGTTGTPGVGTGGSTYDYRTLSYPAVPYSGLDFNGGKNCNSGDGNIPQSSYNPGFGHAEHVRNCRLSSPTDELSDLNTGNEYVVGKITEFLNKLISFGVAGFRLDAAKHMWPDHVRNIVNRLDNLSTEHGFAPGLRPFIFQEVIDLGGQSVSVDEYLDIGRITEFKYGADLGRTLQQRNGLKLSSFSGVGKFLADDKALTFVDNHDNQRGHGAGGDSIITFKNSRLYKIAQAYTLANVYGIVRVMSSYAWDEDWQGPPHDADYNTLSVRVNDDLTCGDPGKDWICEHRWRQIYNMVKFRNVAHGHNLEHWWSNGQNQIAFSRGNRAFIAINNDNFLLKAQIQTGLSPGQYCDIISGNLHNGRCTNRVITVDDDGKINVEISHTDEDPILATHIEAKLPDVEKTKPEKKKKWVEKLGLFQSVIDKW